jgi:hypothetical protein
VHGLASLDAQQSWRGAGLRSGAFRAANLVPGPRAAKHPRGLDDARHFVNRWRVPRPMRALFVPLFRTYVAGRAFDLDEARALLARVHLDEARVEWLEGLPALVIRGRKPVTRETLIKRIT